MDEAKEKIKTTFPTQNNSRLLKKIMTIVDTRWMEKMEQTLHGAAFLLNPRKFFPILKRDVGELRCFNDVLEKMVTDVDLRSKIDRLAILYED